MVRWAAHTPSNCDHTTYARSNKPTSRPAAVLVSTSSQPSHCMGRWHQSKSNILRVGMPSAEAQWEMHHMG